MRTRLAIALALVTSTSACGKEQAGAPAEKPAAADKAATPADKPAPAPPAAPASPLAAAATAVDACDPDAECPAMDQLYEALDAHPPRDLLVATLASAKSKTVKRELVRALGRSYDAALLPVIEPFITDEDWSLMRAAQDVLGSTADEVALGKLAALLDNRGRNDTIRGGVPLLLAKFPQSPVTQAALPKIKQMAIDDAQGVGRMDAARAVAQIEGEEAIPFLVERAGKESWDVARAEMVTAIGKVGGPKATAALKKFAKDKNERVASAARKALGG
jgi:HEAT repeat protein